MAQGKQICNIWTRLMDGLFTGIQTWDRARKSRTYTVIKKRLRERREKKTHLSHPELKDLVRAWKP